MVFEVLGSLSGVMPVSIQPKKSDVALGSSR
jgi:hypothetical protein